MSTKKPPEMELSACREVRDAIDGKVRAWIHKVD